MLWLDVLLAFTLCTTAALVLLARDVFRGIVMFIVFGLLMALSWVRLQAPDIALAEAAIGAGLTGVLLLDALAYLRRPFGTTAPPRHPARDEEPRR